MFSGIIKSIGVVEAIEPKGTTKRIAVSSDLSDTLSIDQSVSHNGVCLTVVDVSNGKHIVEVVDETISKTTFGNITEGSVLNLETSISASTLLDGHIVQGHVDCTTLCTGIENKDGSWKFSFELPKSFAALVILHGSICINGVSLTVADLSPDSFNVAIIPYTFEHTSFKNLKEGDQVNVEFDVIGKYLHRLAEINLTV